MRGRRAVWWLVLLASAACSSSASSGPPTASADPRQNVMVVDTGIDLSVSELRGRVVAAFTRDCPDSGAAGVGGGGVTGAAGAAGAAGGAGGAAGAPATSFDDRKRAYLDVLANPTSCHLR